METTNANAVSGKTYSALYSATTSATLSFTGWRLYTSASDGMSAIPESLIYNNGYLLHAGFRNRTLFTVATNNRTSGYLNSYKTYSSGGSVSYSNLAVGGGKYLILCNIQSSSGSWTRYAYTLPVGSETSKFTENTYTGMSHLDYLCYSNSKFYCVYNDGGSNTNGEKYTFMSSTDGITWSNKGTIPTTSNDKLQSVKMCNDYIDAVFCGATGDSDNKRNEKLKIISSKDWTNWTTLEVDVGTPCIASTLETDGSSWYLLVSLCGTTTTNNFYNYDERIYRWTL